jgi:hypothetical protein
MGKSAFNVRIFDNETLTSLDLSMKESLLHVDKEIGKLFEAMLNE